MHDPKDDRITSNVTNKLASRGFRLTMPFDGADQQWPGDPIGNCSIRTSKGCGGERDQRNDRRTTSDRPNDREASR